MLDQMKANVLAWTTTAAATITVAQLVTPGFIDWIFDFMVVGLVALAAKLAAVK